MILYIHMPKQLQNTAKGMAAWKSQTAHGCQQEYAHDVIPQRACIRSFLYAFSYVRKSTFIFNFVELQADHLAAHTDSLTASVRCVTRSDRWRHPAQFLQGPSLRKFRSRKGSPSPEAVQHTWHNSTHTHTQTRTRTHTRKHTRTQKGGKSKQKSE